MVGYLLKGFVNSNITKGLDISGAKALKFETALKIRFLLDRDVRDFLTGLETYLRRIRTEVSRERELRKGEVRGHVDWGRTIRIWGATGFKDKTTLAISKPIRDYNIPENLILKKIVSILNEFLNDENVRSETERDYEWSQMLRERRRYIQRILRNVHFKKIVNAKEIRVTTRMQTQVMKSRNKMYRDGCRVFQKYQAVFLKNEFSELLKETFINPNNHEKTFELFCLFKVIQTLESMKWTIHKLKEITKGRNETATLTFGASRTINVFYNVTKPVGLFFYDRAEPEETKRALQEVTQAYFGEAKKVTTRRPDIIIEFVCEDIVRDYVVFEVKYTESEDYTVEGIYQALHYLYDLKRKGEQNPFFKKLGKGYNAAVISFDLPANVNKESTLEDKNLKVKLFDFDGLKGDKILSQFLTKFLESSSFE